MEKKVSFLKSKVKIKTIRGIGYSLESDEGIIISFIDYSVGMPAK